VRVLAGDIGGTKTLLALAEVDAGGVQVLYRRRYDSRAHADPSTLIDDFLALAARDAPGAVRVACLGVAGPVLGEPGRQSAAITNLPWALDAAALRGIFGWRELVLLNDFVAVAHGLAAMEDADLAVLQAGEPDAAAPAAVIGAGTGLGMALIHPCGGRPSVAPTEGGHIGFAPADAQQHALWQFVRQRHGRASVERLLSGAGLLEIAAFLNAGRSPSDALRDALAAADPPAALAAAGLAHSDPLASEALDLFSAIYGAVAGDLALLSLPRGGLYIAGGIAPAILPRLREGRFMGAFLDKAPMHDLLRRIPVRVVLNPEVGLLGAARVAAGFSG
jgi:glucokinase